MGWLRERVENKEARQKEAVAYQKFVEDFEKQAPWLVFWDTQDEEVLSDGRTNRSVLNAEKRGIERLVRTHNHQARARDLPCWMPDLDAVYAELDQADKAENQRGVSRQFWEREKHADMVNNFLYQEWLEQLDSRSAVRTYAAYAMFTSAKAVIAVLTTHRNGEEQLRRMHPAHLPLPMREKAIDFKNQIDYDPFDADWFLAHVFAEVPGVWDACQTLQLHYSDFVRGAQFASLEPVIETELPDDPIGESLSNRYELNEEIRIEAAVTAYLAGEGSADTLFQQYNVPRDTLRQVLRDRGLSKRGGDRKAKKD